MLWHKHYPLLKLKGSKENLHQSLLYCYMHKPDVYQTQILSFDCQIVKCDSSLWKACFYCSRFQRQCALHQVNQCLAGIEEQNFWTDFVFYNNDTFNINKLLVSSGTKIHQASWHMTCSSNMALVHKKLNCVRNYCLSVTETLEAKHGSAWYQ